MDGTARRDPWPAAAGLLVAAPLLTLVAVADLLAPLGAPAGSAVPEIAWVRAVLAGLLVATAAGSSLRWLMLGMRHGTLAALLIGASSASLAGGGVAMLAGAGAVLPVAGAAAALLAAAVNARFSIRLRTFSARAVTGVALLVVAEAIVLADLVPDFSRALTAVQPAVLLAGSTAALAAMVVGMGRPAGAVSVALLVGMVGLGAASSALAPVIGLLGLVAAQVIAVLSSGSGGVTVPAGTGEVNRLPPIAGRVGDGVLRFDGGLALRDWNPAAASLLGLDEASHGARLEDVLDIPIGALPRDDGATATIPAVGGLRVDLQRSDGGVTALVHEPAGSSDADRLARELRGTIEELLQARRTIDLQRRELERAMTVDAVTGVPSRTAILDRLRVEVAQARRYQHSVAVVAMDIDDFAALNRQIGMTAGDAVLREVALRIRLRVREADELGRLGSDSFLAVLPHTDEGGAATFADALMHRLGLRPVTVAGAETRLTASFGVAVMRPGEDLDPDGLLARVDEALASARRGGGNRIALDRLHGLARLGDHHDNHEHRLAPNEEADERGAR